MKKIFSILSLGLVFILFQNYTTLEKGKLSENLNTDDGEFIIGAIFQPGWTRGAEANGQLITPAMKNDFCGREPITGWYEDDKLSMERNINQASAFGVDYFLFNYFHFGQNKVNYFNEKRDKIKSLYINPQKRQVHLDRLNREEKNAQELNMAFQNFLSSKNSNLMRFAIQYTNGQKMHNIFNTPINWEKDPWREQVLAWVELFKKENYLIVEGKPVFSINAWGNMRDEFEIGSIDGDNRNSENYKYKTVREALDLFQTLAKENGFPDGIHIIATFADSDYKSKSEMGFTAASSYNIGDYGLKDCIRGEATPDEKQNNDFIQHLKYESMMDAGVKRWWDMLSNSHKLKVLPTVVVGYDNRPWRVGNEKRKCFIPEDEHTPYNFKRFLTRAKNVINDTNRFSDERGWESRILGRKMILISAWNEFGMGSVLAPTYRPGSGKVNSKICDGIKKSTNDGFKQKEDFLNSSNYEQFGFLRQIENVFGPKEN